MGKKPLTVKDFNLHLWKDEVSVALVKKYHYSHHLNKNYIVLSVTLHEDGGLMGNFGPPVAACVFGRPATVGWKEDVVELVRLVRRDDVDISLSSLISIACKELKKAKKDVDLLVSYSEIQRGHHGGIYQACSWRYGGQRKARMDGYTINGKFVPMMTVTRRYKTNAFGELKDKLPPNTRLEVHRDEGKHFYWRAIKKSGLYKAERLGLEDLPYPVG